LSVAAFSVAVGLWLQPPEHKQTTGPTSLTPERLPTNGY